MMHHYGRSLKRCITSLILPVGLSKDDAADWLLTKAQASFSEANFL